MADRNFTIRMPEFFLNRADACIEVSTKEWSQFSFQIQHATKAKPRETWHEETGSVLWWHFPIEEPPYCGTPLDNDWPETSAAGQGSIYDGYYTHWTPIIIPEEPK